jgi:hypothetical protein
MVAPRLGVFNQKLGKGVERLFGHGTVRRDRGRTRLPVVAARPALVRRIDP